MKKQKFVFGRYNYDYYLLKQPRKTISLKIKPNLAIILKCPLNYDDEKIEKFLKRKNQWIKKQFDYFKKYKNRLTKRKYISGESFLYLGRQYKLIITKSDKDYVLLKHGKLLLFTTKNIDNTKNNKIILENWYTQRRNKIFQTEFNKVFQNFDYKNQPKLIIREMSKRWGSYLSDKKIILNPRLIQAPKECIDYVITHELCHLKHKKHDVKFFRLLKNKINNWEEVKEKLELRFLS